MDTEKHCKSKHRRPTYSRGPEGEPLVLLPLTRGRTAKLDREDWEWVSEEYGDQWLALHDGQGNFYATASRANDPYRPAYAVKLQRLIMDAKPGERVTFKNGDSLDCRRSNLRFETTAETAQRKPPREHRREAPGTSARA